MNLIHCARAMSAREAAATRAGFTLVEVITVIAIITILVGVVSFSVSDTRKSARDAERQASLRLVEAALANYYREHGRYPEGCRGAGNWSGQPGTDYACPDGDPEYIQGVEGSDRFVPDYIETLPKETHLPADGAGGYVYVTNAAGSVYKFMAMNTVETETVTYDHPLKSCDMTGWPTGDIDVDGWCSSVYSTYSTPEHCRADNNRFRRSYGVWGGVAELASCGLPTSATYKACSVQNTTNIICK